MAVAASRSSRSMMNLLPSEVRQKSFLLSTHQSLLIPPGSFRFYILRASIVKKTLCGRKKRNGNPIVRFSPPARRKKAKNTEKKLTTARQESCRHTHPHSTEWHHINASTICGNSPSGRKGEKKRFEIREKYPCAL